jgi:hypothetical protein
MGKLVTCMVATDTGSKIDNMAQDIREGNACVKIMSCLASVCDSGVACALVYVDGCDLDSYNGMRFESVIDYIAAEAC